jgi:hypothetical protein
LQSKHAQEASALFVHAEVKGALMNDLMVSTHGIPPASFPPHKSIYSGHFHKPHSVQSSRQYQNGREATTTTTMIEYLGSPYQISLAEAEQDKQLVILDANWQCERRIPLSIGKRHFKASSLEELTMFTFSDGSNNDTSEKSTTHKYVRKGDRIVVTLPRQKKPPGDLMEQSDVNAHVQFLRNQGVMMELREATEQQPFQTMLPNTSNDVIPEDMTPDSTWRAYLKDAKLRELIDDEETHDLLLRTGLKILEDIEVNRDEEAQHHLTLTRTSVHGFGPFQDHVVYPLSDRGLVLLRGECYIVC